MSSYLFQNGSVYILVDGQAVGVPREEFEPSSVIEDKNAHILIAEADGPLLMDHVRQIRRMFPARGIKTCVAYATALRSFLQTRGFVAPGESCLVADDLGDKFLLTASDGRQRAVTRAILSRDPVKIVEEIRRTQKSVMEKDGPLSHEPVFRILSNNAELIEALDPERRKEARFFETSFPVFEVLGKVKFPAQLVTPEELVMQKQEALRRGLVAASSTAVLIAALGAAFFWSARSKENAVSRRISALMQEKTGLEREQQELSVLTYQAKLKASPRAAFMEVFEQFLRSVPPDGHLERASFERKDDEHWSFTGLVSFPRQGLMPFLSYGIFKQAQVEHVFVHTKPGIRISLTLPSSGKEGSLP